MSYFKMKSVILLCVFVCFVKGSEDSEVEARGKGIYALLISLVTVLAAKFGLFKIFLGIAVAIATVKVFVFMAWALAIFKYVPDPYIYYKTVDYKPTHLNPFDHGHFGGPHHPPYGLSHELGKDALDFFVNYAIHFFYVAATKLFILKLVYGALFYVIAMKAWRFGLWFIHYLKEKKHEHYEYIEDYEPYHGHYGHDSYGPQPYNYDKIGNKKVYLTKPDYSSPYGAGSSYGPSSYSKYGGAYKPGSAYGSGSAVYDADGSYAVKSK